MRFQKQFFKIIMTALTVVSLQATAALAEETLSEYAKRCDAEMEGVSVPQFSCTNLNANDPHRAETIPFVNWVSESQCDNPASLTKSCIKNSRIGALNDPNHPNIEIRFLCRHYQTADASATNFDDIAVIQHNKKTGATCFYQSDIRTQQGVVVPAPVSGNNDTFNISMVSGGPCIKCHDNRGFIKTTFFGGLSPHVAIPAQFPEPPERGYFFPGKMPQDHNWQVQKVVALQDKSCSSCHTMGKSNQGLLGSTGALTLEAIRENSNPAMLGSAPKWMGDGSGRGTNKSAFAHVDCAQNGGPDCLISNWPITSVSSPEEIPSAKSCRADQWWSSQYNRCFDKNGSCSQYTNTDNQTCETSNDSIACDWDQNSKSCFPEVSKPSCNGNQWYSSQYNRCFEKKGTCGQYSFTDTATCETPNDSLACDWSDTSKTCFDEPGKDNGMPKSGKTYTLVSRNSNKCLDVVDRSVANGAELQQWDCSKGTNQQFHLVDAKDGTFQLVANQSNKCISVKDSKTENGTPLLQWDCFGEANQRVNLVKAVDGAFKIKFVHSNKCADVEGSTKDNGKKVKEWDCLDGVPDQDWFFRE